MPAGEQPEEGSLCARFAAGERAFGDVDLMDADLDDAVLPGIVLTRASLRQAHLSRAVLTGAELSEANLMGAVLERAVLSSARLSEANLMGVVLRDAQLDGADLTRVNLVYADVRRADLHDADLCGADLSGSDLGDADLTGAALAGATLNGARLEGASLSGADLDGADLTDAKVSGDADLLGCTWRTLVVGGVVYQRDQVERGLQTVPIGKGDPLVFHFHASRELNAEDLVAVRQLVRLFDALAEGATLSFEITQAGERMILGCGGDSSRGYRDAFELGLRLMQAAARSSGLRRSKTRVTRELADSLRSLSSAPPPPPTELTPRLRELLERTEAGADVIARMLTAFMPTRVQLRNAEDVRGFQEAAAERGVVLDELVGGDGGWTLLPRFVAHYLRLPLDSELLPHGLLSAHPPASTAG